MGVWDKIAIGLQLTVYGTGLVFLVLAFLWGLMVVLLRLDPGETIAEERPPAPEPEPTHPTSPSDLSLQERAALAIAVRLHTTKAVNTASTRARGATSYVSPNTWVVLGRTRQLRKR